MILTKEHSFTKLTVTCISQFLAADLPAINSTKDRQNNNMTSVNRINKQPDWGDVTTQLIYLNEKLV